MELRELECGWPQGTLPGLTGQIPPGVICCLAHRLGAVVRTTHLLIAHLSSHSHTGQGSRTCWHLVERAAFAQVFSVPVLPDPTRF